MKATATTVIIWIFLLFVAGESVYKYLHVQGENRRLLTNLTAANQKAEIFKTRDGHNAARITAQELTISELKQAFPDVATSIKNMYIPPRRVESFTQTSQQMQVEVKAQVTGIVIPADTIKKIDARVIKTLKYQDKWVSISGELDPDTAKIKVLATDTIFTAIYRGERRHPWAWFLSKRKYQVSATNRNPYIAINVIQSGVIKK